MHADRRRCERIVRREDECSPVLASVIRRIFRASDYVVPFEDVRFGRMGGDVWRRILGNGLELSR